MKRERVFVFYPFLVAVYGVFALAAKNYAEVLPSDLMAPLALSLIAAGLPWSITAIVTRDRHMAGLIALASVVWFGWYGYLEQLLANRLWLQWLDLPTYGVPLALLLIVGPPLILARRYAAALPKVTRYLNATAVVLLAIPTTSLLVGWANSRAPVTERPERDSANDVRVAARNPIGTRSDVYLIILDEYTGARSLKANFGFDNAPFEDSLRSLGFAVPRAPRSNYVHTHLALAAMLNWRLLDGRPTQLRAWNGALAIDYNAIEDNRTWRYLRSLGYRFVFFPSAYPGTSRNRFADLQLPKPSEVVHEFGLVWSRRTILIPVASLWCRMHGCGGNDFPYKPAPADLIDWKFEKLAALPDSAGPLFVFAHLVVPHEPYIFNANCSHRTPMWPRTAEESNEQEAKAAYVAQIKCVNSKLLGLASELLAKSRTPPIIVLQADHGNGRLGAEFATLPKADPERVDERIDLFAAYYLPGQPVGVVYDSITPVNVLPRIFNHYFNAGISLQPDATYWSTWQEPFAFSPVP
jgi:hypothetical protein